MEENMEVGLTERPQNTSIESDSRAFVNEAEGTPPSNTAQANHDFHEMEGPENLQVSEDTKPCLTELSSNKMELDSPSNEPLPSTNSSYSKDSKSTEESETQNLYHVKWISWQSEKTPIVTQNENGPCPLIAIFNVLLLSRKIQLDITAEIISTSQIMTHIANVIWENMPKELPECERLNYEQNVSDAMSIFPNLLTGLDVNVKFSSVTSFEYTQELTVYDLLRIPLYHGWLIDPQDVEVKRVIGNLSYNQIVEKIITNKSSEDNALIEEGLIAEQFLESTASQITCHGIVCLCEEMRPGSLAVLFRNNHFSTLYRHKEELLTLVTDLGFLREINVVWETLSGVQGDSHFVDGDFLNSPPKTESVTQIGQSTNTDYDYQIALSLQQEQPGPSTGHVAKEESVLSDYEYALKLQEQEQDEAAKRNVSPHAPTATQGKSRPQSAFSPEHGPDRSHPRRPATAPHRPQQNNDKCIIL